MDTLKKYAILEFPEKASDERPKLHELSTEVPINSRLLKTVITPDGIYGLYAIPESSNETIHVVKTQIDRFSIIVTSGLIPPGSIFIDTLTQYVTAPPSPDYPADTQAIILFSIFKLEP